MGGGGEREGRDRETYREVERERRRETERDGKRHIETQIDIERLGERRRDI